MNVTYELMLAVALAIAIVLSIGLDGMIYLGIWLKSKLTQSPKIKTEPTHSDSQGS